jgi:4-hydroxybenzoate polyprenyltransferase
VKFLRRLIQPRNPAFWIMLALNGLSAVLLWIAQNFHLSLVASLVVMVFALGNAVLGLRMLRQLLNTPSPDDQAPRT